MNALTSILVGGAQDPETGNSLRLELADDFETVFNKVFPATPPASQLQAQQNVRHTLADGRAVAINPMFIALIEEAESNG